MENSNKGFNSFSHKADSDKENSVLLQTNEKTNEQSPPKIPLKLLFHLLPSKRIKECNLIIILPRLILINL